MRVLFTCVAATGHFHPLVPVARALPGPEGAVVLLERLAAERRPLRAAA